VCDRRVNDRNGSIQPLEEITAHNTCWRFAGGWDIHGSDPKGGILCDISTQDNLTFWQTCSRAITTEFHLNQPYAGISSRVLKGSNQPLVAGFSSSSSASYPRSHPHALRLDLFRGIAESARQTRDPEYAQDTLSTVGPAWLIAYWSTLGAMQVCGI
jgi:hypothetical protein